MQFAEPLSDAQLGPALEALNTEIRKRDLAGDGGPGDSDDPDDAPN